MSPTRFPRAIRIFDAVHSRVVFPAPRNPPTKMIRTFFLAAMTASPEKRWRNSSYDTNNGSCFQPGNGSASKNRKSADRADFME